ncbi:MAG: DUF4351 domain-containing protein [Magnetococcales bacterium]|nr:DUF4351 domain-containing protein [Magnetococcales bacterium]
MMSQFARDNMRICELRGRQEGKAETLLRQVQRRFGLISDDTRNRIASASIEQLELWSDRILDASTLDEMLV